MATTVNTLETNTEVFKGDRIVADGVERELGDVTPTGTAATYGNIGTAITLSGANLIATKNATSTDTQAQAYGIIAISSGVRYWEVKYTVMSNAQLGTT